MGYYADFLGNGEYGAAHWNARLAKYVTAGIEDPFTDGTPYNTTIINEITVPISASGVVPESDTSCKVTINATTKTVTISQGTCFFDNGTMIEFDTAGSTLSYTAGTKHYVYVKSDLVANTIAPYCSTTEPTTGDFVMLAEISTAEVLTDTRKYARGKLPGYQSNVNSVIELNITDLAWNSTNATNGTAKTLYLEDYTFLILQGVAVNSNNSKYECLTKLDLRDGSFRTWIPIAGTIKETGNISTNAIILWESNGSTFRMLYITDIGNGVYELRGKTTTSDQINISVWGL